MDRYFLKLAFRGTDFHGWQIQENATSVQGKLNEILSLHLGHPCETVGCGRTDTGVHALNYYAHFETEKRIINKKQFLFKLNKALPESIACYDLIAVSSTSHARFDAVSRTYQYFITRVKDPFIHHTAWFQYGELDLVKMQYAAKALLDYSDFRAFCKTGADQGTTLCEITRAEWEEEGTMLTFTITANRFLRNMVRAIVGTMIDIGQGKTEAAAIHLIIQKGDRSMAGPSAPAHGLFLTDIRYKEGILP